MLNEIDRERLRALELRAYAIGEGLPRGVETQAQVLEQLARWGFATSPESRACRGVDAVIEAHEALLAQRAALPIEIDGTVVKVDRLAFQNELGHRVARAALGGRVQVPALAGDDHACSRSRCRSGAPARSRPSPSSSPCASAASRSRTRRCTTATRSSARTCASATRW
jgi:hypothetical protein